jgi:hypothetical protein
MEDDEETPRSIPPWVELEYAVRPNPHDLPPTLSLTPHR